MASAYSHPVSGKIDNKINLFRQNIDENKAEVNRNREEMKQLIDKKSDELLRELEGVWEKVNDKEKKREVSERIETVKKEIDTEIPVVKLNWKLNALKDSINDICSCSIQEVPNSPVTPKPGPYDKLEGNELDKLSEDRVIAYFNVQGKDVTIRGTILNTLSDKSYEVYYELHTDNPVPSLVRDEEIKLRARRTTTLENSLFVRDDQCGVENPGPRK